MMKPRLTLSLNLILLISLLVTSCAGAPTISLPDFTSPTETSVAPTNTVLQQAAPPALIETEPPLNSVIGHLAPIAFYFNQPMNKASVEAAFSGLPAGAFTWIDEATLVFTPSQPYTPNSKLELTLANTLQSATGFGLAEPLPLTFTVADYLRATNTLPEANALDVNVDAAIVASFNQPIVPLGAEAESLPDAFTLVPSAQGQGEWVNTSTYIFYPNPPLAGGAEYAVSLNPALQSVTSAGFEGTEGNAWKFVTARPQVISLSPSEGFIPLDPELVLTFNQPMDEQSVEGNFKLTGTDGTVNGAFEWNDESSELTFVPGDLLARNAGYSLIVSGTARAQGGVTLGADFGTVLQTFPDLAVTGSNTQIGGTTFTFSAPLPEDDYADVVIVTPEVELFPNLSEDGLTLNLYGSFSADTDYVIELPATLSDLWGGTLSEAFVLDVHTPPLPPSLTLRNYFSNVAFVRPDEPVLYANVTNIPSVELTVAPLSLPEFFSLQESFENQQAFTPANALNLPQNFPDASGPTQTVQMDLTESGNQLLTGMYYVGAASPQFFQQAKQVYFAASSQVNLTFKLGATEAFVWAVDLPSQTPVANAPVVIYDNKGAQLAAGVTDASGIWQGPVSDLEPFSLVYAVLGTPGSENFALSISNWSSGISAWDFGYVENIQSPQTRVYMYSDRAIYRPGQTVYFRGIAREAFNGRYTLPTLNSVSLALSDANGTKLTDLDLALSPFGTFNGQVELPPEAVPGYYTFTNQVLNVYFSFQVAEYRKSEIDLGVDFANAEIQQGDATQATVNARYFFDAPAGDVNVRWAFYVKPDQFSLANFQTGLFDDAWLDVFRRGNVTASDYFGIQIGEGTGQTSPRGTLSIDLPAIPESEAPQLVTLEVTALDESGLPVSARTTLKVHPADFYVGVRPDQWFGTARSALGFDVYTADWAGNDSGEKSLTAEFKQVRWEKETDANGFPIYTPVYTPISSTDLATGPDGRARLSFVPPNAGTYLLDVSGEGARTQVFVWVGGAESAAWADLPENRLQLIADKDTYVAGDTARVFIPNPFATSARALVTVERGLVAKAEVITLSGSGTQYSLPLTDADAPNVYLSVTALGQGNNFKHGLVNLKVAPDAQQLNVQVAANPSEAGPRDPVTFDVYVTDNQGQPVEGEFSFAVVDKAVLALADPNSADILPAFYSNQPLGIGTNISLMAYGGRETVQPGGMGGGGGGPPPFIREDFPDTAYWNPSLITNSQGRGQVTLTLPDSLTTWNIDVRGLTLDTKVGQAQTELVATKPLLIRPVTPRFLVSGDRVLMAAIINNNTSNSVRVAVNLQSTGFVLEDPSQATLNIEISANGRHRVEWWGTAGQAEAADLVFSATTTGTPALQDSARPVWGSLPILHYTAPQTFVTGGVLRGATSQQEVISLPRTFTPTGGGLEVEFSPSLAGNLLSALEAIRPPEGSQSAEAFVSYLVPNIEVQRALNSTGMVDAALSERLKRDLNTGVSRLLSLQNLDGGWNWWGRQIPDGTASTSDLYISTYVFFGLQRARLAGASVSDEVLRRAGEYVVRNQPTPDLNTSSEMLDNIAFIQYTLSQVGAADANLASRLYEERDRMSPAGRAWTALVFNKLNPADTRVRDLLSNLETAAIVTASSAHWETPRASIFTRGSAIYTTSIVTYALAQLDPASQTLSNAVRYLAAHRNASGLWNLGHDNAWAIIALNEAMLGMGDLRADFAFNAALNGGPLASGDIAGIQIEPITAIVPLEFLSPDTPNLLTIQREDGLGRLYYNAALNVNHPVQDVRPLDNGMRVDRVFCNAASRTRGCAQFSSVRLASAQPVTAQLTLVLPHDSYYVMVEDFIPAGMEILNQNLKTSQLGLDGTEVQVQFDDRDPFAEGWGWWLFNEPQIRDDGILFSANFLPAGTYVLTYTLIPLQAGEYRVLPAHAWQAFFPEVQGTSAGAVFEIEP